MGPIQKAVREGGDFWRNHIDGLGSSVYTQSRNYSVLRRAHTRNSTAFNAHLNDRIHMELCTKHGRLFQEGF